MILGEHKMYIEGFCVLERVVVFLFTMNIIEKGLVSNRIKIGDMICVRKNVEKCVFLFW